MLTSHSLLAAGIQRLLEEGDGLELSLVAADDAQWLARVRQLLPHVIVLDSGDASLGEGAITRLLEEHPKARVVALNLNRTGIEVYQVRRLLHTNAAGLLDAVRGREPSSEGKEQQNSRMELGRGETMGT